MKALDKNRNRRYESASGFGLDIQRYLAGESVLAAPPSRLYNARKFVTRNRGLVSIVLLLFLTLVAGIVGTSYGLVNARLSAIAEGLAKSDAQSKQKEAEQQRTRAEAREQQAINAVKRFGDAVRDNPELKHNPSFGPLRKTLLQEPFRFFKTLRDDLENENDEQFQSLEKLSGVAFDLGQLIQEIANKDDALKAFQQSLSIRTRLLDRDPSNIGLQHDVSATYGRIASLYLAMGQRQVALKQNQLAIERLQKITQEAPGDQMVRRDLGGLHNNIGNIYQQAGDTENASMAYEKAIEIGNQLVADAPVNKDYQSDSIKYRQNLAIVLASLGKYEQAIEVSKKGLLQAERLLESSPNSNEYKALLSVILNGMGFWIAESNGLDDAMPIYLREASICEEIAKQNPSNKSYQAELAKCYFGVGKAYERLSKIDLSVDFIEKSIEISERIVRENPTELEYQTTLAMAYKERGELFLATGSVEDAKAYYQRALKLREELVRLNPDTNDTRIDLALSHLAYGNLLAASDRQSAIESFDKSISILEKLIQDHPNVVDNYRWIATCLDDFAMFEIDLQELDSAREHLLQAEAQIKIALKSSPTADHFLTVLRSIYSNMNRLGDAKISERAKKELAEIIKRAPDSARLETKLNRDSDKYLDDSADELLATAGYGYDTLRYSLASKVYEVAIQKFPEITQDRQSQVRYNAACSAALASSESNNNESLDGQTKKQLRKQAIAWLRAELVDWKSQLDASSTASEMALIAVLNHWKTDSDLASLRDQLQLEKLDDGEQQACRSLWNEVEELLKVASQTKSQDL